MLAFSNTALCLMIRKSNTNTVKLTSLTKYTSNVKLLVLTRTLAEILAVPVYMTMMTLKTTKVSKLNCITLFFFRFISLGR